MSELVGNPEDRFSCITTLISKKAELINARTILIMSYWTHAQKGVGWPSGRARSTNREVLRWNPAWMPC